VVKVGETLKGRWYAILNDHRRRLRGYQGNSAANFPKEVEINNNERRD